MVKRSWAVALGFLVACGEEEVVDPVASLDNNFLVEETEGDPTCDNLSTLHCMWPFPSDTYRQEREDGSFAVVFPEAGMPVTRKGVRLDSSVLERSDGFGIGSPILFQLEGALVDREPFDVAASVAPGYPTALIDADTGERLPHWFEYDVLVGEEAAEQQLVIRPAVPLPRGHRVVVGVRGVTDAAGALVAAPEGFAALRDQEASTVRGIHARRDHFEDAIFPVLDAAGFARDELQLAWDFTVATDANATRTMIAMRDRMFDLIPDGPTFEVVSVEPAGPHIARHIEAIAYVPSFVLPEDEEGIRRIRLDDEGLPVAEGVEEVPFSLQIPHSVLEAGGGSPTMMYGHGFMGRRAEANNSWMRESADRLGFAVIATNMQGMSENEADALANGVLNGGSGLMLASEEAFQGMNNQLALQRLVTTQLLEGGHEALLAEDGTPLLSGEAWYYGNSQGGSVGTIVTAMSQDVERGVLGVPGCCYPFLLQRSSVFAAYADVLGAIYPSNEPLPLILGILGTAWDSFDPLTYAVHMSDGYFPDTPKKSVLLHVAKEDAMVHNEASFILARATGSVLMTPAVREVDLVPTAAYPYEGNAMVEVDFMVADDPTPLDPAVESTDTHGWLRKWHPAQDQLVHFLATGEVIDVCDGAPCVTDGSP